MAEISRDRGQTWHTVKNLGWLLAHRTEVTWFGVSQLGSHRPNGGRFAARLYAYLGDENALAIYRTDFADAGILRRFLERPSWHRVSVDWSGHRFTIGAGHGFTTDRESETIVGGRVHLGDLATLDTGKTGTVIQISGGYATITVAASDFGPTSATFDRVQVWRPRA